MVCVVTSFYQRPANHVSFYLLFNLRNLFYLIGLSSFSEASSEQKAPGYRRFHKKKKVKIELTGSDFDLHSIFNG